jgi:hypothetical protein
MIERLASSAAAQTSQAIQPVVVPAAPGVATPRHVDVLVHGGRLIGEMNWLALMNAFQIARILAAQQLRGTTTPGSLSQSALDRSTNAPIPSDALFSEHGNESSEPSLIPTILQPAEDHEVSNYLDGRLDSGREALLGASISEIAGASAQVAESALSFDEQAFVGAEGAGEEGREPLSMSAKRKGDGDTTAIATRPAVFRGYLIRVGQTSRFVPGPAEATPKL